MNIMRDQIRRLEAKAASADGEIIQLTSKTYMQGIRIKVLEQDRDMAEASLAATCAALMRTQDELERLRSREDKKRKAPAE